MLAGLEVQGVVLGSAAPEPDGTCGVPCEGVGLDHLAKTELVEEILLAGAPIVDDAGLRVLEILRMYLHSCDLGVSLVGLGHFAGDGSFHVVTPFLMG